MNTILSVFVIFQITSTLSSSFGRYRFVSLKQSNERQKRMHPTSSHEDDCMFNICEHVDNYPAEAVEKIITQNSALHSYFGGSVIEPSNSVSIFTRIDAEPPEPFCKTKDVSSAPREMIDIDGVSRRIANVGNFSQILKYQICSYDNGGECYPGNTLSYQTACVQKFNDIKLVTVNVKNDVAEYRKFKIPSTCICTYTRSDD